MVLEGMAETNYCPNHPRTETNLRCGRCDDLVCPQCMVHTPVGVRCKECANVKRIPTFDVSGSYLTRAIIAGVAIAVVGGVLFVVLVNLDLFVRVRFLSTVAIVGIGYAIGEGISLSVNRRRGRRLQFVAGGSMLLATIIINIFEPNFFGIYPEKVGLYPILISENPKVRCKNLYTKWKSLEGL